MLTGGGPLPLALAAVILFRVGVVRRRGLALSTACGVGSTMGGGGALTAAKPSAASLAVCSGGGGSTALAAVTDG